MVKLYAITAKELDTTFVLVAFQLLDQMTPAFHAQILKLMAQEEILFARQVVLCNTIRTRQTDPDLAKPGI